MELFSIFALSLAVGVALIAVVVWVIRWIFLAPLIKELKEIQSQLSTLHTTDEYASRQLQSIWHSVNMIRDGQRPDA